MKTLEIDRKEVDIARLRTREAMVGDCRNFTDEPTSVYENGKLKIIYAYLDAPLPSLVEALKTIPYEKSFRSGGLPTISRIFGYAPRSTIRKDFCSATSLANQFPQQHEEICKGARVVSALYEKHNPELFQTHKETTDANVRPEWKLEESPFTSGIANRDNQLRYHFDSGNFANVWSAMLVFKHKITGGHLSVPEYDLCFELKDNSVLMFDGQGLLHGVTPFKKLAPDSYRFSVVYYSLRQMWNCLTPSEELLRIRKLKTEREYRRAGI